MMAPKFEWSVFQIHSQKIWLRQGHTFKKLRVCDTFDFFSTAECERECIRLRYTLISVDIETVHLLRVDTLEN